jgi:hypothetical protein
LPLPAFKLRTVAEISGRNVYIIGLQGKYDSRYACIAPNSASSFVFDKLKMEIINSFETSVINYQYSVLFIPQDCRHPSVNLVVSLYTRWTFILSFSPKTLHNESHCFFQRSHLLWIYECWNVSTSQVSSVPRNLLRTFAFTNQRALPRGRGCLRVQCVLHLFLWRWTQIGV